MYKPESVLGNENYVIFLEIQTDHPIQSIKPDLELIDMKKTSCSFVDHRVRMKESEKIDKCLDLERKLNKAMEHESDYDSSWG